VTTPLDRTAQDAILDATPDAIGDVNPRSTTPEHQWGAVTGIAVIGVGVTVLCGWFLDTGVLRSVLPTWPSMKPNTAVVFVLLGLTLWATDRPRWRRLRTGLLAFAGAIVITTLVEYAFAVDLHIDELLHGDVKPVGTAVPGRMAITTAVAFLAIAVSLGLTGGASRRRVAASQVLAAGALGLAFVSLAGYLYAVPQLYGLSDALMGMHTCLAFVILSLGALSLRPRVGLVATMTATDAGGHLARRLLPAAILVPLGLAWVRWPGQRAGLLGTQLGLAIFAVSNIAVFGVLVLVTARSISAIDQARRSATARLLATRDRELVGASMLAAIVESSADAIIGKTLDGVITSWNAGAEQMYGYSASEIVGRPVSLLVPPGRAGDIAVILDRVARGSRVERHETLRVCKDGTVRQVAMTVSPIRDAAGIIVGASAVTRDMTEQNLAEAERRELEGRLHQTERLESVGQLAGGIAHDFNNLLGVIMNYAAFVIEQTEDLPEIRADAAEIQSAAERAARLTKQLLIFARREAIKREAIDLNAIVADMENLLSRSLGEHIDLVIQSGRDLPTIRADKGQMEQVLVNLVVNARDAMPAGGTLTVETTTTDPDAAYVRTHPDVEPGRHATLTVSDTGIGMSADVAARIFEPFFTTKPKGEGTGLGLATVYGIVREAGGDVSVSSEEGAGTTFRVDLRALDAPAESPPGGDPARRSQGHGETVLVVEDEPAMLELTSRILQRNGYTVLTAASYEEAIGLATDYDFQLLLTDSIMPQVSGHEVTDRILEQRPDRAVLYMSGYTEAAVGTRRVIDDGATLLQKPFTQQQLLDEVHLALSRKYKS
jgi:two-component system cell cycle sensor histidine kinase/response regulator CckA